MTDYMDPDIDLDDARLQRLQYDSAIGILTPAQIALRYGFPNEVALKRWFLDNPSFLAATEKMKAAWESERGANERARAKALQATEDLIAPVYHIAQSPKYPPQVRVDAFKQLTRVAGVDGAAAAAAAKAGVSGTAFTLNILFQGRPPEHLSMVPDQVIEHEPVPAARGSGGAPRSFGADDDAEYDEDV